MRSIARATSLIRRPHNNGTCEANDEDYQRTRNHRIGQKVAEVVSFEHVLRNQQKFSGRKPVHGAAKRYRPVIALQREVKRLIKRWQWCWRGWAAPRQPGAVGVEKRNWAVGGGGERGTGSHGPRAAGRVRPGPRRHFL